MSERVTRSKREEAGIRLLSSARELLETRRWASLTVSDFAAAAGISRTAFYQHFPDREQMLMAMLSDLDQSLHGVAQEWITGGTDPLAEQRASLLAVTGIYLAHGRVLRAAADMAASDPGFQNAWSAVRAGLVDATAHAIERDVRAGFATVENPYEMARALSATMEQYLLLSFGQLPLSDPREVADTLTTVLTRSLYPTLG